MNNFKVQFLSYYNHE